MKGTIQLTDTFTVDLEASSSFELTGCLVEAKGGLFPHNSDNANSYPYCSDRGTDLFSPAPLLIVRPKLRCQFAIGP